MLNDRPGKFRIMTTFARHIPLLVLVAVSACSSTDRKEEIESASRSGRPVTLVDAIGASVRLKEPARRVVTLAPNLTESLCAIGGRDLLIGRTSWCDYPASVSTTPVIGNLQTIDYERIVSLRPDLILMSIAGNSEGAYRKLESLQLRPFALDATTIDGVIASLDTIGVLVGRETEARRTTDSLRRRIDRIRVASREYPTVSVLLVINRAPLMSVSRGFLSEAIDIAGGRNIVAGDGIMYPAVNREELLRHDPDVIIVPGTSADAVSELLATYPEWRRLRAVRNGRIHVVSPDPLMRPGPRLVDGIEELARLFHPPDAPESPRAP